MHSHQELFDREVGRLPDSIPPELAVAITPLRTHLDYLVAQMRKRDGNVMKNMYVDLVDDLGFNAVAFTIEEKEFVGINAGLAVFLPYYCQYMLSDASVFPDIGNASAEEPSGSFPAFDYVLLPSGPARKFRPGVDWRPQRRIPNDPARFAYASTLSLLAWDFLIVHEVAHIIRCHIPYLQRSGYCRATNHKLSMLHEFDQGPRDDDNWIRRTLEVDADCASARIQIGGLALNKLETWRIVLGNKNKAALNWDWSDICIAWQRAVRLLFEIFGVVDGSSLSVPGRCHPHPDVRMFALVSEAWRSWQRVIRDVNMYRTITTSVRLEIEALSASIFPSAAARARSLYLIELRNAVNEVETNLNRIGGPLDELTGRRMALI